MKFIGTIYPEGRRGIDGSVTHGRSRVMAAAGTRDETRTRAKTAEAVAA